jgi:TetR/AcrR family transcriptional repressor of nem operon
MAVFWRKGYEATTMQDLVEAMGINRGSLYDTFQDKRQLFLAAIAHYTNTQLQKGIACLAVPGSMKGAIAAYFQAMIQEIVANTPCQGCLMTNAIIELSPHDPEIATCLKQALLKLEDAFYAVLVRGVEQGELPPKQNLRILAQYLTVSVQGLWVVAKLEPDALQLQAIVQTILLPLESPESSKGHGGIL